MTPSCELQTAEALGMRVVPCDPPRQAAGETLRWPWAELATALACDVVSLHVPLTRTGKDATWHLLDDARLRGWGRASC